MVKTNRISKYNLRKVTLFLGQVLVIFCLIVLIIEILFVLSLVGVFGNAIVFAFAGLVMSGQGLPLLSVAPYIYILGMLLSFLLAIFNKGYKAKIFFLACIILFIMTIFARFLVYGQW